MKITNITASDNISVSVINSDEVLINDVDSEMDFIMEIKGLTGTNRIVLNKSAVNPVIFDLKNKILGELLQKFVNYNIKIAIVGDFSSCGSKAFKDFIYETNKGNNFFIVSDNEEAIKLLSKS
ncbi:DUF4180 domain-containing protein [Anaerofustis sp.]|uniref:DUF4180 domain-containing protein n=1 Tax=Anaerofustis sp. TaxID=1872517 RepID=UPI0025BBDA36|nr:DUF4180 domain-containing protein [Anaerofustis sp.]